LENKRVGFTSWVTDEKLKQFLHSKDNFSQWAIKLFNLAMSEGLDPDTFEGLKKIHMKSQIEWKKAQTEYLKKRMIKMDSEARSSDEKKVIQEGVLDGGGFNPPEQIQEDKIKDFISDNFSKYVSRLKQEASGFVINCGICPTGFPNLGSREIAVERLKLHVFETHKDEVIGMMRSYQEKWDSSVAP